MQLESLENLERKFILGSIELADPIPSGSLDEVVELLSTQYPMVRFTRIYESDGILSSCGRYMEYTIQVPPVKTNG